MYCRLICVREKTYFGGTLLTMTPMVTQSPSMSSPLTWPAMCATRIIFRPCIRCPISSLEMRGFLQREEESRPQINSGFWICTSLGTESISHIPLTPDWLCKYFCMACRLISLSSLTEPCIHSHILPWTSLDNPAMRVGSCVVHYSDLWYG